MAEPYRNVLLVSAVGILGALGIYYATQPRVITPVEPQRPYQPASYPFPLPPTGQETFVPVDPAAPTVALRTGETVIIAASSDDPVLATPEALALAVMDLFRQQTTLPVFMLVSPIVPTGLTAPIGTTLLSAKLNAFPGAAPSTSTYARMLRAVQPRVAAIILARRVA